MYMEVHSSNKGTFRKVGECLYRYSNGVYYARFKADGKEIRRSLWGLFWRKGVVRMTMR
jgi:hypothetical protein